MNRRHMRGERAQSGGKNCKGRQKERENKQGWYIHRCRKRQISGVREFDERIPTGGRNKPISSADQIEAAVGAAPLLAEEEEEEEKRWRFVF